MCATANYLICDMEEPIIATYVCYIVILIFSKMLA